MTDQDRPAYSSAFLPEAVAPLDHLFPNVVTREWAWEGSQGRGVRVAVIDSGIETTHPAIGGPVSGFVDITEGPDGLIFETSPHDDAFGHGTACAGIIRSIAPECELYSVRVLGPRLSGRGVIFAAGLRWAIEHGMHVCNLSLGTTKKDFFAALHELADEAYFQNVTLVAAANNMSVASFPSVYASVVSVASTDDLDPYRFLYNPAPPVEFGAPGIDVRVAWLDGSWGTMTGNSFAAPHITGIVAKILGKHPGLTPFQIKTILRELATNTYRS